MLAFNDVNLQHLSRSTSGTTNDPIPRTIKLWHATHPKLMYPSSDFRSLSLRLLSRFYIAVAVFERLQCGTHCQPLLDTLAFSVSMCCSHNSCLGLLHLATRECKLQPVPAMSFADVP